MLVVIPIAPDKHSVVTVKVILPTSHAIPIGIVAVATIFTYMPVFVIAHPIAIAIIEVLVAVFALHAITHRCCAVCVVALELAIAMRNLHVPLTAVQVHALVATIYIRRKEVVACLDVQQLLATVVAVTLVIALFHQPRFEHLIAR
jgi:hypothetical protein